MTCFLTAGRDGLKKDYLNEDRQIDWNLIDIAAESNQKPAIW